MISVVVGSPCGEAQLSSIVPQPDNQLGEFEVDVGHRCGVAEDWELKRGAVAAAAALLLAPLYGGN